jgi:hypothetical protein
MKVRYGRFSKKHANQAATGMLIVKFMMTILSGNAYNDWSFSGAVIHFGNIFSLYCKI